MPQVSLNRALNKVYFNSQGTERQVSELAKLYKTGATTRAIADRAQALRPETPKVSKSSHAPRSIPA